MPEPERLRSINVPADSVELRIHGVSGTIPEDLLKDHPIRVAGDEHSGFYRSSLGAEKKSGVVEAYCWGGLTSSSRLSALWLLLLPFSLLNVAGWMTPARDSGAKDQERHSLLVRFVGLSGTAFVSLAMFSVSVDLFSEEKPTLEGLFGWVTELWPSEHGTHTVFAMATLSAGLVVLLWATVSRMSRGVYEAAGVPDGIGRTDLALETTAAPPSDLHLLWDKPGFVAVLNRLHLGMALSVIGALAAMANLTQGDQLPGRWSYVPPIAMALSGLVAVGCLGLVVVGTLQSRAKLDIRNWSRVVMWAGVVAWLVTAFSLLWTDFSAKPDEGLLDWSFVIALLAVGILVGAVGFLHLSMKGAAGKGNAMAFLILSFVVMGGVGSGLTVLVRTTESDGGNAVDLLACIFLTFLLAIAIRFVGEWKPLDRLGDPHLPQTRLRDAVLSSIDSLRICALALSAMVVALVIAFPKFGVPSPYSPGFSSLWLPVLVLYSVAFRGKAKVGWTIAIALAAVGAAWMIGVRPRYGSASLPGDLFSTLSGAFVATAKFVALTAPLAAVAWFVFRASSNRDNRRAIGVFWDLTNYWPRWFHPWAAPPYTEVAIHDFQKRIEHLLAEADVGNVVISAHSQGAVITMPVLAKLMSEQQPAARLKLMTYGCLIGQHYRILFPRFFTKEVVDDVQGWLDGRWRNLYRITDPLGHPIGLTGNSDIEAAWQVAGIDEVLSHSDYQYSPEYQGVLSTL